MRASAPTARCARIRPQPRSDTTTLTHLMKVDGRWTPVPVILAKKSDVWVSVRRSHPGLPRGGPAPPPTPTSPTPPLGGGVGGVGSPLGLGGFGGSGAFRGSGGESAGSMGGGGGSTDPALPRFDPFRFNVPAWDAARVLDRTGNIKL